MRASDFRLRPFLVRASVLGAIVSAIVVVGGACDIGGDEGDRCNPLVLHDECHSGLHCIAATCTESYCCPIDHSSTDPNCNGAGCPDTDAGDEGGTDEGGTDGGGTDAGTEAAADAAPPPADAANDG